MEDENGIELSLGLSCGGSSSKSKVKDPPVDIPAAEGSRNRNAFESRRFPELWSSNNRSQTPDSDKEKSALNKRKLPVDEANPQKKLGKGSAYRGHVALANEDGSSAEQDDESEAEGSSSWLAPPHDGHDVAKGNDPDAVDLGKSTYGGAGVMQLMPFGSSDQTTVHHQNFGYSSVQFPTLETHASWIFGDVRRPGDGASTLEHPEKISPAMPTDGKASEAAKGSSGGGLGKQADDAAISFRAGRINREQPPHAEGGGAEGFFPLESSAIKPGIAANLVFGGCGTQPDLPWVSATGPGPGGKTISGVTYKYSPTQVKIVCACHGSHMTPDEFIQHATGHHPENSSTNNNSAAPV